MTTINPFPFEGGQQTTDRDIRKHTYTHTRTHWQNNVHDSLGEECTLVERYELGHLLLLLGQRSAGGGGRRRRGLRSVLDKRMLARARRRRQRRGGGRHHRTHDSGMLDAGRRAAHQVGVRLDDTSTDWRRRDARRRSHYMLRSRRRPHGHAGSAADVATGWSAAGRHHRVAVLRVNGHRLRGGVHLQVRLVVGVHDGLLAHRVLVAGLRGRRVHHLAGRRRVDRNVRVGRRLHLRRLAHHHGAGPGRTHRLWRRSTVRRYVLTCWVSQTRWRKKLITFATHST